MMVLAHQCVRDIQTEGYVAAKGAAIVMRVTIDGKICPQSNIELLPLINDSLVTGRSVSIGQIYSAEDVAKMAFKMATFNLSGTLDIAKSQDLRVSFQPITPGDYGIYRIICSWDAQQRTVLDASSSVAFGFGRKPSLVPLQQDGKITVKKGEILDAGLLNIVSNNGRAIIVASPTPQNYIDTMKRNLPALYPKVTFRQFHR